MKHLLALLALTCCFGAHAQTHKTPEQATNSSNVVSVKSPLVYIDGQQTAMGALILQPDKIKQIDVLKGQEATDKYGDKAIGGAVNITLKEQTQLARLPQVYSYFKVPARHQKLRVTIDGNLIEKPELILVELGSVKQVVVDKRENPFLEGGKEKFLNLVTE